MHQGALNHSPVAGHLGCSHFSPLEVNWIRRGSQALSTSGSGSSTARKQSQAEGGLISVSAKDGKDDANLGHTQNKPLSPAPPNGKCIITLLPAFRHSWRPCLPPPPKPPMDRPRPGLQVYSNKGPAPCNFSLLQRPKCSSSPGHTRCPSTEVSRLG